MTSRDAVAGRDGRVASDDAPGWVPWSGLAAAVGGAVRTVTPWVQAATLGDRPYVATGFDAVSLVGTALLLAGLVGVVAAFSPGYGRAGRAGTGALAVGMALTAGLSVRSVGIYAAAGFENVPAFGEDPAGLVLTWAALLGLGLSVGGAGALGVGLRRLPDPPTAAVVLLLAAPAVPLVAVLLDLSGLFPLFLGRLLVGTNAALVPFGAAWIALGAAVWKRSRPAGTER